MYLLPDTRKLIYCLQVRIAGNAKYNVAVMRQKKNVYEKDIDADACIFYGISHTGTTVG